MACGKCGGNRRHQSAYAGGASKARAIPNVVSKAPVPVSPPKEGFCQKCGWAIKRIRYIDVKTNQIVEKWTCPNRACSNYNG
jgi:hypothetical protein